MDREFPPTGRDSCNVPATRSLVLGIGTGRCGTHTLAELLNRQPDAWITHEQRPVLPWHPVREGPGIHTRLERFQRDRSQRLIGDVALFYLPYIEEAIAVEPALRVICLERPCEEVVASYCRWLDAVHPLPTNHWAARPCDGWHHDPVWTRVFPQYETSDRAAGIRLYWEEYRLRVAELSRRFPGNVRVFPMEALNSESGVRSVLSFAGVAADQQVVLTGLRRATTDRLPPHPRQVAIAGAGPDDPRRCAVLVPCASSIAPACAAELRALRRRGYTIRRGHGVPLDLQRSQLATDALVQGFEETMWIDPDTAFDPDDVDRLRAHGAPIVCGLDAPLPQGQTGPLGPLQPDSFGMGLDVGGGLVDVRDASGRFLLIRRHVYMAIQRTLKLPVCNEELGRPLIPFFQPALHPWDEGWRCLAGVPTFGAAAQRCGYRVVADPAVRLGHLGS
jgi:hypothetical protein